MDQTKNLLVIGVDGMIGSSLAKRWANRSLVGTTHLRDNLADNRILLDMSGDVSAWRPPEGIHGAVICAAVTSMARCEAQPEQTRRFNVHNTLLIAEKLVANGAFLVFLSTSQVFDGSVPCRKFDDPVCPRTQYGSQKAEVEQRLLSLGNTIAVVRFTKVIGPDNSLIHGWMQTLQEGRPIRPFADAVMSPLPLTFAVDVLDLVVCKKSPGIFQVSGEQDITYEEAARYVARCLHASCDLIRPVSSQQSGLPSAFFPAHTTLDMSRLRLEVGLTPPDTWAALDLAVNP